VFIRSSLSNGRLASYCLFFDYDGIATTCYSSSQVAAEINQQAKRWHRRSVRFRILIMIVCQLLLATYASPYYYYMLLDYYCYASDCCRLWLGCLLLLVVVVS
jgi:hypothetical protein